MHTQLSRLRGYRPDALALDRALAVLLTIVGELEIWLGSSAGKHQVGAALITPVLTASIAFRRRYPMLVGVGVPVVMASEFAFWAGPNILTQAVANFCALYALTVWTTPTAVRGRLRSRHGAVAATALGRRQACIRPSGSA